ADADLARIVNHRATEIGVRAVAGILAGIETVGMPRLGQKLLYGGRVEDRLRRWPIKFEAVRYEAAGELGIAEGQCLVDAFTVDREVGGAPHSNIVPRRFRVPLVGKVKPERRRRVDRLQGESGRRL